MIRDYYILDLPDGTLMCSSGKCDKEATYLYGHSGIHPLCDTHAAFRARILHATGNDLMPPLVKIRKVHNVCLENTSSQIPEDSASSE